MVEFPANSRESTTSETSSCETEISHLIGSHGLENSYYHLTMEKLNGRNFREWAQSIKLVIDGKGKLGYLFGETKSPADTALL